MVAPYLGCFGSTAWHGDCRVVAWSISVEKEEVCIRRTLGEAPVLLAILSFATPYSPTTVTRPQREYNDVIRHACVFTA